MSRARISIVVYSIYLAIAGTGIALVPTLILPLAGLSTANQVWARLAGCLAFMLAVKELQNSRYEIVETFQLVVYTRLFVATFLVVLVLLRIAAPIFLLLAALDCGGATWTHWAIRADRRSAQPKAA